MEVGVRGHISSLNGLPTHLELTCLNDGRAVYWHADDAPNNINPQVGTEVTMDITDPFPPDFPVNGLRGRLRAVNVHIQPAGGAAPARAGVRPPKITLKQPVWRSGNIVECTVSVQSGQNEQYTIVLFGDATVLGRVTVTGPTTKTFLPDVGGADLLRIRAAVEGKNVEDSKLWERPRAKHLRIVSITDPEPGVRKFRIISTKDGSTTSEIIGADFVVQSKAEPIQAGYLGSAFSTPDMEIALNTKTHKGSSTIRIKADKPTDICFLILGTPFISADFTVGPPEKKSSDKPVPHEIVARLYQQGDGSGEVEVKVLSDQQSGRKLVKSEGRFFCADGEIVVTQGTTEVGQGHRVPFKVGAETTDFHVKIKEAGVERVRVVAEFKDGTGVTPEFVIQRKAVTVIPPTPKATTIEALPSGKGDGWKQFQVVTSDGTGNSKILVAGTATVISEDEVIVMEDDTGSILGKGLRIEFPVTGGDRLVRVKIQDVAKKEANVYFTLASTPQHTPSHKIERDSVVVAQAPDKIEITRSNGVAGLYEINFSFAPNTELTIKVNITGLTWNYTSGTLTRLSSDKPKTDANGVGSIWIQVPPNQQGKFALASGTTESKSVYIKNLPV